MVVAAGFARSACSNPAPPLARWSCRKERQEVAPMQMENLQDLMKEDLKDVLHAENQIVKALPKMIKTASNPQLQQAFQMHLEETKGHVGRLEEVMGMLGMPVKAKTCKAMQGIIEEGKEVMSEDAEDDVMDAALIGAAQKVEHYEIATYGTLCTYAELLGLRDAKRLLGQNLEEEKRTDAKLTQLAESVINLEAADAD
jgi:ferritin-like metal-binding protein YciE